MKLTKKKLIDWAGKTTVKEAESIINKSLVLEVNYEPNLISGTVLVNNWPMKTSLKILPDGYVENLCPCSASRERYVVCAHVIALALTIVMRSTDPNREKKYQEEKRRAKRLSQVDESEYIQRAPPETPGAIPAEILITINNGFDNGFRQSTVNISCSAKFSGKQIPLDQVPKNTPLTLSKKDESILTVLEDVSEGPALSELDLDRFDFLNIISLHAGRTLGCLDGTDITVNEIKMNTVIRMDLDRENGEILLIAHTELPFMKPGNFPAYIIAGQKGWIHSDKNLWPLNNVLPGPYRSIYEEPVIIQRPHVLRFMGQDLSLLSKHAVIESDISFDLFTIEPAQPEFKLTVEGSHAWLAAKLYTQYDDIELVACKPDAKDDFGIPDPEDLMRYTVRNPDAEKSALQKLQSSGFVGERGDDLCKINEPRHVLNFLGTHVPALRREGWKIELNEKVAKYMDSLDFVIPVVHISENSGSDWFDVGFDFEDGQGTSLSPSDVHGAIRGGDSFLSKGKRTLLIDSNALKSMQDVFSDCASGESDKSGHFRMQNIFAAFVKSSLDALDGFDMEDTKTWRSQAAKQNRKAEIEPVDIGKPLNSILRPYQKDGVNWLRFLENNGFCGILADEMGLGKTLQTLVWLQLERTNNNAQRKPALIVCPTSLVDNWTSEAERFVPHIKTLTLTGADRHERWQNIQSSDMAVTSYAILRRDIDRLAEHEFSVVVLDEAQHIKNRSTSNAVSAKKIKAHSKLVLTGTPVENSVSDLWSIMDFLMPGYLGSHDSFKLNYEIPINNGHEEAETAQKKLRRKLHPFLMRRLKKHVAKDLPEKIEKLSLCLLTKDQQMVYNELLKQSQQKISGMVSNKGFNKSRMEILATLMRLRQVCCHLDLLKLPGLKAKYPSAKLDMFFELIDEALDSGHRILVFSQFVSMLTILRKELEKSGIGYCYLDGSTKERMLEVKKFNTCREIPLFLISLKAGGTGLNLTGADMVIHFDPWWNPAVEDQATDRAHRIGQKRTVYNIKLISKGTVEEKVLEMQRKKKAVINATIESDEKMVQSLSWEDVQNLLDI